MPRISDAEKAEVLREFFASGQSQRQFAQARRAWLKVTTLNDWITKSAQYGVVPPPSRDRNAEIKRTIEGWLNDPEKRLVSEYCAQQPKPIPLTTMHDWLKNSSKYGVAQEKVKACTAERKNLRTGYWDADTKKALVIGYLKNKETVSEYTRRDDVNVPRKTFEHWLKHASELGLNQDVVDLAVKNRADAHRLGAKHLLNVLHDDQSVGESSQSAALPGDYDASWVDPAMPSSTAEVTPSQSNPSYFPAQPVYDGGLTRGAESSQAQYPAGYATMPAANYSYTDPYFPQMQESQAHQEPSYSQAVPYGSSQSFVRSPAQMSNVAFSTWDTSQMRASLPPVTDPYYSSSGPQDNPYAAYTGVPGTQAPRGETRRREASSSEDSAAHKKEPKTTAHKTKRGRH
ncbi:hypothetical protein [Streptomyces ziwulingensis]|uniref:Uncharacterized protein n=1 Tax=Streptomyces ziwulingensis TaxID=1045501 RepID=A0ABP9CZE0_9ACTN